MFIWSPGEEGRWAPGAAARYWLHQSLRALAEDLEALGSRLILRSGDAVEQLGRLLEETHASAIYWNRRYEPAAQSQEQRVRARLSGAAELREFPGNLLFEPHELKTKAGGPFRVFTPFYREALRQLEVSPGSLTTQGRPRRLRAPLRWPPSLALEELRLLPAIDRAGGIRSAWTFGERAAMRRLRGFLSGPAASYDRLHDRVGEEGTSRLSAHLHFGELSPQQIWRALQSAAPNAGVESFRRQMIWREFAHHVLAHFPELPERPLDRRFERMRWSRGRAGLEAWKRGRTGYPLVDAAMRQLWQTGWMHNRARMVAASFLIKDLLIDWREGQAWFWDTLVDGDLASNAFNWQWVAGCGADPAPFFRVFNPLLQAKKFDPHGQYIRRFLPELARLPDGFLHEPAGAPRSELSRAGIVLGKTYPRPIVDHAEARDRALLAFTRRSAAI